MSYIFELTASTRIFNAEKARHKAVVARGNKAVERLATVYRREKQRVSTRYWTNRDVHDWKVHGDHLEVSFSYWDRCDERYIHPKVKFPLHALEYAMFGSDKDIGDVVAEVIEEERLKIERQIAKKEAQEAKQAAKRAAQQERHEREELARLQAKYQG